MKQNTVYKTIQICKIILVCVSFVCVLVAIFAAFIGEPLYEPKYEAEACTMPILYSIVGFFPVLIYHRLLKSAKNTKTRLGKFLLITKSVLTLFALLFYALYVVVLAVFHI